MSRGTGKLQNSILHSIAACASESLTGETLRWQLRAHANSTSENLSNLTTAWNTSFQRAIKGLSERGRVTITRRPLHSLEECVQHYAGKTLKGDLHWLRSTFLPVLLEWTSERDGLSPRYGIAQNELYQLRLLQKDRAKFEILTTEWRRLEEQLRPIYGGAPQDSDDLLQLICKGRDMFGAGDIDAPFSFTLAVQGACARGLLPDNLASDLKAFLETFIPATTAATLRLRSFVHEIADVPRTGRCTLRLHTLEYLHRRRKDLVEKMPGFEERKPKFAAPWGGRDRIEIVYSPQLRKLFDQTVFQDFSFINAN